MRNAGSDAKNGTAAGDLVAFEIATRDLVGVALRSVDRLEVSLPQFRLLLVLHELGRSSSTQCARALDVAGSSVTRLADRLHASGHLIRSAGESNRSVVTLELTTTGRRVVEEVTARRRAELGRVLGLLDPDARAACAATLTSLHERLGDEYTSGLSSPMPL